MEAILKKYLKSTLVILTLIIANTAVAQDCVSELSLNLKNVKGGVYANQIVVFKSLTDGAEYSGKSDASGMISFNVPCGQNFNVSIANYNKHLKMTSPNGNGEKDAQDVSYAPNRYEKDLFFSMNATEKVEIDHYVASLPDTTATRSWMMSRPKIMKHFSVLTIKIRDLRSRSLASELVTMTGLNRNKSFRARTSPAGVVVFYLPKGDKYSVNFKHTKEFASHTVDLTHGSIEASMELMYIGTVEFEKRMREQERRNADAEERMRLEREEFLAWCEANGLTEEEGYRQKLLEGGSGIPDTVVTAVFNRNKWKNMLVVGDLTGSMTPYAGQLTSWCELSYAQGNASQFVFFNDGDGKPDSEKEIGSTGGVYYQACKSIDELVAMMAQVRSNGGGGDCPENNMEALIKGVRNARSFTDLIMLADNNAPVKDIELLGKFNHPVHIVLCGVRGNVLVDYLNIALKTGGSVHTIEDDFVKIGSMKEGQILTIRGVQYRIMGGEFVRV